MRKKNVLLLTAILLFSLLGCSVFDSMSMLSLPELSPEHAALAKYINAMTSDASWSVASPESGENRTAMQFVDFYGDGISEAVVFYKNAASLLLRICVYTQSGKASSAEMCRIDAPGDAFVFAEYVDLNGDGSLEMVAGMRYGSTSMYALKVYSLANNTPTLIADTTSSNYVIMDMDGDGVDDLLTAGVGESGEGMSGTCTRRSEHRARLRGRQRSPPTTPRHAGCGFGRQVQTPSMRGGVRIGDYGGRYALHRVRLRDIYQPGRAEQPLLFRDVRIAISR